MRPIDAYIRGDIRAEARVLGYEHREPLQSGTRRLPGPFVICRLRREVRWVQTSSLGAGPWDPKTVEAPHGQPCPLFSLPTDHLLGPLPPVPTQPPTPAQAPAGQGLRVRRGTQRNAGCVGTRGSDVPAGGTACLPPRPHPVRIPVDSVIETNKLCKINKC